jgi:glutamyl/glutaminyl-tRNA synthetase
MIILKSDGLPTYHLANVVDDHIMGVTHVLRGQEWIPSTTKHLFLYRAFGWEPPFFAHLPLLTRKGGEKLSKRQNDVSISFLRENGYLPEALLNFVALLGWTPQHPKDLYSLEDLCREFDIERVSKSGAVVSLAKLDSLNRHHIRRNLKDSESRDLLVDNIIDLFEKQYPESKNSQYQSIVQDRRRMELVIDAVHVFRS